MIRRSLQSRLGPSSTRGACEAPLQHNLKSQRGAFQSTRYDSACGPLVYVLESTCGGFILKIHQIHFHLPELHL